MTVDETRSDGDEVPPLSFRFFGVIALFTPVASKPELQLFPILVGVQKSNQRGLSRSDGIPDTKDRLQTMLTALYFLCPTQDCLLRFKWQFFKGGVIPAGFAIFAQGSPEAVRIAQDDIRM